MVINGLTVLCCCFTISIVRFPIYRVHFGQEKQNKHRQTKEGKDLAIPSSSSCTTAIAAASTDCGASWADKEKEWPINYPCARLCCAKQPPLSLSSLPSLSFYVVCASTCVCVCVRLSIEPRKMMRKKKKGNLEGSLQWRANNDTSYQCKKKGNQHQPTTNQ